MQFYRKSVYFLCRKYRKRQSDKQIIKLTIDIIMLPADIIHNNPLQNILQELLLIVGLLCDINKANALSSHVSNYFCSSIFSSIVNLSAILTRKVSIKSCFIS
jgi:hypothetical protein